MTLYDMLQNTPYRAAHTYESLSRMSKADLQLWQAEVTALPFHLEGPGYQLYAVVCNLQHVNYLSDNCVLELDTGCMKPCC